LRIRRGFFLWLPAIFFAWGIPLQAKVLVRFEQAQDKKRDTIRLSLKNKGASLIRSFPSIGWESWEPPPGLSDTDFLGMLQGRPGILEARVPARISLCDRFPDDPDFIAFQWALYSSAHPESDIDAPQAWDVTTGTKEIVVVVIDSGVDLYHPDLAENLWHNPGEIPDNGIDDDKNGFVDDVFGWDFINETNLPSDVLGHGAHVSGIIGGVGNNGIGISGVCWRISLVSLKVFEESETTEDVILAAFDYILGMKQKAHIVNASWGTHIYPPAMRDAVSELRKRDILFCASAGNDRMNNAEHPSYPACFNLQNVVSVAATDVFGNLWSSSNYGAAVSVAAPGAKIYSTIPAPGFYASYYGTSMAAPHVSGAAALLLSVEPDLSPEEIRCRIIGSASPLDSLENKSLSRGLLNLPGLFCGDDGPPASITDLSVSEVGLTTATLEFTLPHDDLPGDPVKVVEVRCAPFPINLKSWWEAFPVPVFVEPGNPGEKRSVPVSGLSFGISYNFAARSLDECGNLSPLSNVPTTRTLTASLAYREDFEKGAAGWEQVGALWDVASSPGLALSGAGFLIHPEVPAPYPETDAILSPWIDLSECRDPYLQFSHQYEFYGLERLTNEGRVELLAQGETEWRQIGRFKIYYSPWKTETISLGNWRGRRIRLRFKFYHVFTTVEDEDLLGWWIDDVKILEVGTRDILFSGFAIH